MVVASENRTCSSEMYLFGWGKENHKVRDLLGRTKELEGIVNMTLSHKLN